MTEAQGRVGRWLRNKWHLDSLIAIGGMAAVYSSTHRNGARAAIKMLHSQYTRNEQARRRFLAEGYAANKVGHRNAVLVLDDDATEDGEVYLVMELLDGESLEGRLERVGVMSPMEVLELTDALLEVLACAHPKGILHRDIKPANIYLTRDGAVKLLDFGLARVRELSAEAMDQSDGIVFGTVSYIAPEQARADNQNLDARSDMWSIAATMFRALSGETVHPSTGPVIDRLMAVARKPPRSIATVVPHLPRQVIELVDRALAFDPENRWPSCNVMRVVVQDVMAQLREEAEAQANADDEMTGMFTRPPHGLPPPMRHRTGHELPAVRSGPAPVAVPAATQQQQQRPKTDPVALSTRPKNLPVDDPDEVDLDVDLETAPRPEARGRRSRTLLTKEGRAELRRILDARKAGADVRLDEPTPRPAPSPVQGPARVGPQPSESGTADIDVEVEDSIIEVTIDHTHRARPGPIAEALADNTTPAPVRSERATGSFAAVPEDRRSTGSFAAVPEDRRSQAVSEDRRATNTFTAVPSGEQAARASGGLEDSRSRREAAAGRAAAASPAVPEDRRTAATASYPTLGGATSKPIQPQARGEAQRPSPRDDDITRVAAVPTALAPVSGELGARGPGEITRVGAAPAPPAAPNAMRSGPAPRAPEPVRPGATLHDTLRPKTIPPVSRPTPASRPPTADSLRPPTPPPRRPEATKPEARPAAVKPEPTPEPTKMAPQSEAKQAPQEARAAAPAAKPATSEARPEAKPAAPAEAARKPEAKPSPEKPAAVKPEPTPASTAVIVRPDPTSEPTPVPAAAQARAGVFAAPPSRTAVTPRAPASPSGPVEPQRVVAPNPPDPARSPAPASGIADLTARGVARSAMSEPAKVETPPQRSPAVPAAPHAAPSATQSSSAAPPAAAATAPPAAAPPPAATARPAAAPPAAATARPTTVTPAAATARPATAAPAAATARPATAAPAAAAPPATAPPAATAAPEGAAVPTAGTASPKAPAAARTAAYPTISAEPSPVPKDSPVESAARAAAPTAAHPVVPPEEGAAREAKAKAGAPPLPFSFLRPGPASRPAEPASDPPSGDGVPPRKKS